MSASPAWAYRPFDGTDADVPDRGEAELDLEPLQYLREGGETFLVVPSLVANFSLSGHREVVFEARDRSPGTRGLVGVPISPMPRYR
jgi:hypothetical protein